MTGWFIDQETENGAPSDALVGKWALVLEMASGECLTLPVWFETEEDASKYLFSDVLPASVKVDLS